VDKAIVKCFEILPHQMTGKQAISLPLSCLRSDNTAFPLDMLIHPTANNC